MKRYILITAFCLATVLCVAQPPRGGRPGHDGRGGPHMNGRHHRTERVECLDAQRMEMVLRVLKDQSFDDKRLEVAKLCVSLGAFCTSDLAQVAETFSFDDRRLEFLRFAYPYCLDPENYFMLKKSFSFESNFNALMESIHPGY
ncbi:MAG: DUF4476 domain-containing protein [Paludibacteraceae bacterium]|nr:DUF4476 domain-containing protein [Paludibacteraceae bacterium]